MASSIQPPPGFRQLPLSHYFKQRPTVRHSHEHLSSASHKIFQNKLEWVHRGPEITLPLIKPRCAYQARCRLQMVRKDDQLYSQPSATRACSCFCSFRVLTLSYPSNYKHELLLRLWFSFLNTLKPSTLIPSYCKINGQWHTSLHPTGRQDADNIKYGQRKENILIGII